jgi:3-oxoadipate enol-lactonase / 4-carboxymuconolactone decarboxylase
MPFANSAGARIYWRVDGRADAPALILVNSLGTDHAFWAPVLSGLTRQFRVIRLDNRGHGASDVSPGAYSMEQLGRDVLAVADAAGVDRFHYAGVSIGGMIGMWLAQNAAHRLDRLVLSNTSAYVDPSVFDTRIDQVRKLGLAGISEAVLGRFFTPGYIARRTEHYETVRQTLLMLDPEGYNGCCAAIRDMQIAQGVSRIDRPTLVISGTHDQSTPAEHGRRLAGEIPGATYIEMPTAHFSHSECPGHFIDVVVRHLKGEAIAQTMPRSAGSDAQRFEQGLERRKQVLGESYVNARLAATTPLSAGFQDFITRYAWGELWTRPVLDDRTRRLLVLVMMCALGRWEEFKMHVRQGRAAELDMQEVQEILMCVAIYCGVPAANTAFHHLGEVLAQTD